MGLSQSLYTGWSGLATHQKSMDNSGNNLANVNTVGYRKSDFMFSDLFSQVMSAGLPEDGVKGSTNPKAVGLGVSTGAILHNFKQGPIEGTGNPLDCAIKGNGFFLAATSSGTALTRNGSFYLDHTLNPQERMLCVGEGLAVQGWMAQNGTINPSGQVGNIYLPAYGDMMPGKTTAKVGLTGILPTNIKSGDFAGRGSTELSLKGNVDAGSNTMTTHIFAPVTKTDGTTTEYRDEVQEIKVEITFDGPVLSPDGTQNTYSWTMKTVDWPNPGDPQIQIYPPPDNPGFNQDTISFYAQGSVAQNRGEGQIVANKVAPGSTSARYVDADGVASSFTLPTDFTLDVSRLTSVSDAPGGNALETWHVNGNPKNSMARTVMVYDEYTDFTTTTDASGATIVEPVRRVEARENTIYFTQTNADETGLTWEWRSSMDDATGVLKYNTIGDLVSSSQSGGSVDYDFSETRSINYDGSLQVTSQDGYRDGFLKDISIDQNGKIWGHYTNDVAEALAQLAIGTVPNTSGLEGVGGNLFYPGSASGGLMIGIAGDGEYDFGIPRIGAGMIASSSLEGSNVDLSQEFTNLINIERGYQFNSRVVTTSDEMLQTALQLKR